MHSDMKSQTPQFVKIADDRMPLSNNPVFHQRSEILQEKL